MSTLSRIALLSAAGMLLVSLPALAKPKPVPVETADIVNTGSTNTFGYKITVASTKAGSFSFVTLTNGATSPAGKPIVVTVQESRFLRASGMDSLGQRAQQFFADLDAAMPLTGLPARHGMRSASFGTATYITYKGQKSPDLTFAGDPRTSALKTDIDAITKTLHIGNMPRRPMSPIVIHADR
ncbi:MAG: hypothetical protein ACRYFS_21735 [Janthinobacterium lividum]